MTEGNNNGGNLHRNPFRAKVSHGYYELEYYVEMRRLGFLPSIVSFANGVSGLSPCCYAFNRDSLGASRIFKRIELEGLQPNYVTWTSIAFVKPCYMWAL
ncbi:pentatricopeptide repeat-containing protein [Spatholobus suberectus]|nr:pentatricopeptide repeat-containing protein [Spatholobus suberectus]